MQAHDRTRKSIQLADYWRHDTSNNTLVIPVEGVRELLGRLPIRPVQVIFDLRARPPPVVAETAKGTPA